MFCPNCGTDNSKGQKFCTRCGTNLLAIDRAREIISEVSGSAPTTGVSPNLVFIATVLLSMIGFIAVTLGTYELARGDGRNGPLPFFFMAGGFTSLVLICRYLIGLIRPTNKPATKTIQPPLSNSYPQFQPVQHGNTNRALNEASVPYQSVIEDPTRQFEHEKRSNS
ncbi:MAG: zinc ribbon domain-containing protein [Acidobacteria bacterium]|nr:zinc ribbon domain-containing protein [Acidobacteriota bacterium]